VFDPKKYFDLVDNVLASDHDRYTLIENDLYIAPKDAPRDDWDPWTFISWKATISFATGHRLYVSEAYHRTTAGVERCPNYHFMDDGEGCIFRIDSHGQTAPFDEACHIHIGNDVYENGDRRLKGFDLVAVDFPAVFRLAYGHTVGKKFPWG